MLANLWPLFVEQYNGQLASSLYTRNQYPFIQCSETAISDWRPDRLVYMYALYKYNAISEKLSNI